MPLVARFAALARIPRAALGTFPTPVERLPDLGTAGELWIKRDDLNAPAFGGNKVRSLEFLLGGLRPGDVLLTLGGEGSTHVLTTSALARELGARVQAVRWRHDMNPTANAVASRTAEMCERIVAAGGPMRGIARAYLARLGARARWIPLGGTSPLGMLGHVNAALELAEQIADGVCPLPTRIVVPLGSGGTMAGLALGLAIAELDVTVVGVRVAPRIATGAARVLWLARRTASLIGRVTGERVPAVRRDRLRVVHDAYGGAYGRPLPEAAAEAALLHRATGVRLDGTYSEKAFHAALRIARRDESRTLFWLTFDGRWMEAEHRRSGGGG